MSPGPTFAILTPVWGEAHVRRFLDVVAPSWLAPGNLDALAREEELPRLLLLTRRQDMAALERSHSFLKLRDVAQLSLVPIDDLLGPGSATVTLTLAYHRGLDLLAADGRTDAAVLLNADFLLAEGALRSVRERMISGARVVLAPSLRVVEADLVGELLGAVDRGVLALQPRRLVGMALGALHPTVICAQVDQTAFRSTSPIQLFWRPSPQTLIARPFCMFALALRIERPFGPATSYCDYSLASDAYPDIEPEAITDSDAFLALELADRDQEAAFFQLGPPSLDHLASTLGSWTTAFHRRQVRHAVVFKAAEPPADLPAWLEASADFADRLVRALPPPRSKLDHPAWLGGVAAWRQARALRGVSGDPPELGPTPDIRVARSDPAAARGLRGVARRFLVGVSGARGMHQPYHRLEAALDRRRRGLTGGPVAMFGAATALDFARPAPRVDMHDARAAIVGLDLVSPDQICGLVARLEALPPGSPVLAVVIHSSEGQLGIEAIPWLGRLMDPLLEVLEVERFDLALDQGVERAHGDLAKAVLSRPAAFLLLTLRSLVGTIRVSASNVFHAMRRGPKRPPARATAALFVCARRAPHHPSEI